MQSCWNLYCYMNMLSLELIGVSLFLVFRYMGHDLYKKWEYIFWYNINAWSKWSLHKLMSKWMCSCLYWLLVVGSITMFSMCPYSCFFLAWCFQMKSPYREETMSPFHLGNESSNNLTKLFPRFGWISICSSMLIM